MNADFSGRSGYRRDRGIIRSRCQRVDPLEGAKLHKPQDDVAVALRRGTPRAFRAWRIMWAWFGGTIGSSEPCRITSGAPLAGTQLIQDLIDDGLSHVARFSPDGDKIMRLHAQSAVIENGFVFVPEEADLRHSSPASTPAPHSACRSSESCSAIPRPRPAWGSPTFGNCIPMGSVSGRDRRGRWRPSARLEYRGSKLR